MRKFVALLAVMFLATWLTACGRSEAEKQADAREKLYNAPIKRGWGY